MLVWLLAMVWQARNGPASVSVPRRLVWVVNRRVVVDQATTEAQKLRERLMDESLRNLVAVRDVLRRLSGSKDLIAVSTLRGQFADNAAWRDDPARPSIIVGTVDMIGSRLLFSGYGVGFKHRPLHAGFLGQDSLLVHDEAHLEPAFQRLVDAVKEEQKRCEEFREFHVMALTATSRDSDGDVFELTDLDRRPGTEIHKRIEAAKGIAFHRVESEKGIADGIAERALEFRESGKAILVFATKVEDVAAIARKLGTRGVETLAGTIRGWERDRLARESTIFARFSTDPTADRAEGTVYLVCTSAGEVGVNISADHLVCDLAPFDSMSQRLGRVNRFGDGDAQIDIVYADVDSDNEFVKRRAKTLKLLKMLPLRPDGRLNASPAALESLPAEERHDAFTPEPEYALTSEILFDAWAFTSLRGQERMPGRPPVCDWLHGIPNEWEPGQTYVAWREDVEEVDDMALCPPEDLLEDYPLKPYELLRDASRRVIGHLKRIAARSPRSRVWLVTADETVKTGALNDLLPEDPDEYRDCTVLLPPSAGGLTDGGLLDGGAKFDEARRYDVADEWIDEHGQRKRFRSRKVAVAPDGMRQVRRIALGEQEDDEDSAPQYWRWYVRETGSRVAPHKQVWSKHQEWAEQIAKDLVVRIGLPEPEASAVVFAAKWHDSGKRRELWQRSIGNHEYPDRILAKSGPNTDGAFRAYYRHEFGSVIDLMGMAEFAALSSDVQDLVLHLVAAHHGRARPHFSTDEIFDPEHDEDAPGVASETPRRFARLQRKYGRWGLAYLESLVRAADVLASRAREESAAANGGGA